MRWIPWLNSRQSPPRSGSPPPQSDGTTLAQVTQKGDFYRSSRGDTMITQFAVNENGVKNDPGRSTFTEASSGRVYLLRHGQREALVKATLTTPLLPNTRPPAASFIANSTARTINGVSCLGMKVLATDGSSQRTIGVNWHSMDLDLSVRTEIDRGGGRQRVRELYDIQFTEPAASSFGVPARYSIIGQ